MSVHVEQRHFGELYCPSCETSFPDGRLCPRDGARLVKLAAHVDPIIGRDLDGRFTVIEKLGQGGMGAVYRAHQHSVDREVAIKVVHANLMSDPAAIKRFLREAKLTSKLNHPNAVGVLDFGQTDDGVFYLVMELVTGRTLDQVLHEEGIFSPGRVVKIGTQVCDALEVAHAMQIVHRDLKPANIMMLSSGRDFVKVLDFGIAKLLDVTAELTSSMTGAGAVLGTPAFLPPERVEHGSCDGRSDLYSLGCVLYLLGTGELPFRADSAPDLVKLHRHQSAPRMANVPRGLAEVIDRMLAKNPGARYQSAAETRDALEAAVSSEMRTSVPISVRLVDVGTTSLVASRPRHRKRGWVIAMAVVACGVAATIGFTGGGQSATVPLESQAPIQMPPTDASEAESPKTEPEIAEPELDEAATGTSTTSTATPKRSVVRSPKKRAVKKRPNQLPEISPAQAEPAEIAPTEVAEPAKPELPF